MPKGSATDNDVQEFRIAIQGFALPEEQVYRIKAALEEAFLTEVARLDLAGDITLRRPRPPILGLVVAPGVGLE